MTINWSFMLTQQNPYQIANWTQLKLLILIHYNPMDKWSVYRKSVSLNRIFNQLLLNWKAIKALGFLRKMTIFHRDLLDYLYEPQAIYAFESMIDSNKNINKIDILTPILGQKIGCRTILFPRETVLASGEIRFFRISWFRAAKCTGSTSLEMAITRFFIPPGYKKAL